MNLFKRTNRSGMSVEKIKEEGEYKGYSDKYGYVYEVKDALYALKSGNVKKINEELIF